MLEKQLEDVELFHRTVTGMPIPEFPEMLVGADRDFRLKCLYEELDEFKDASTIADQADALIDLIYFAYGGLLQMGIPAGPAFQLVHDANMQKRRGKTKRGGAHDAAKPEGWEPPNWEDHLGVRKGQYIGLSRNATDREQDTFGGPRPNPYDNSCKPKLKILLLGHGRHGKDTVAEMLRDQYGYSFASSSMFCAERVMLPYFEKLWKAEPAAYYQNVQQCFDDRHNHRATWFREIENFNTPDKTALGRAIFAEHDIYCGLRSRREFAAVKNSNLYDVCVWVDASDRMPPEGSDSCTVEPWMADYVLDNNGTLEELAFNLKQLMENLSGFNV